MAVIIKEKVKSKDLKAGDYITKGFGSPVFRVSSITSEVKLQKLSEDLIVGFPKAVFDGEEWHRCEPSEKVQDQADIQMRVCDSSNILREGYDEESQTLQLEFSGGGKYRYTLVPKTVYERFLASDSKGREFANSIKGKYPYKKV
jgi:hypothetical protein